MRKIIAIVGNSGSGKDTLARVLERVLGIPPVCSYTTRKMRTDETDGVEHKFITHEEFDEYWVKHQQRFFAYTKYGNEHYFTTNEQFLEHDIVSYVVDEAGVLFMKDKIKQPPFDNVEIITIFVTVSQDTLKNRGIHASRTRRDINRDVSSIKYDFYIPNDGTVSDLEKEVLKIKNKIS